ncbi:PREDICTED: uncharacterized protein LOC106810801 isoform X2 [Priapulus caudatus]|nr:PREDICTED: uncharacterized protein LOC106810801 isoform X2 [Priapulus caudatus]
MQPSSFIMSLPTRQFAVLAALLVLAVSMGMTAGDHSHNKNNPPDADVSGSHLNLSTICDTAAARIALNTHDVTTKSVSLEWVVCRAYDKIHGFRVYWRRVGIDRSDQWTKSLVLHEDIRHHTIYNLSPGTVYEVCTVERSMNGTEGSPRLEKCDEIKTPDSTALAMGIIIGILASLLLIAFVVIVCLMRYYKDRVLLERAKGKIEVSRPIESTWPEDWESRRTTHSNLAMSDVGLPSRRTTATMVMDNMNGQGSANVSNVSGYSQRSGKSEKRGGPLPPVPPSLPQRDDSFFHTTGSKRYNQYGPKPPPPTEPPPDDSPRRFEPPPHDGLPDYDKRAPVPLPKPKELTLNPSQLPPSSSKYLTMENSQPTPPMPRPRRDHPEGESPPMTWKEPGAVGGGDVYLTPSDADEERNGGHVYHYIPYETIAGEENDHIANTAL